MNVGRTLVCGGLMLLLAVSAGYGKTKYDRTLDGKTKVLHNAPAELLQPSWSGDRDEKGYATGQGTLTWFRTRRGWETGSLLPSTKYIPVKQYTGKMVEGKLEGSVVSVDPKGQTYHAKFADGLRTGQWVAGPVKSSKKKSATEPQTLQLVEAPAEGPPPAPKLDQHVTEKPSPAPVQTKETAENQPVDSKQHVGDSLRSLAIPPSSLRLASVSASPAEASEPPSESADKPADTAATTATEPKVETPSTGAVNDDDARTVAALDSEYQAAVKTNDAATIDRILADDFVLVRGTGSNLSKADLIRQAREKQGKYEHHEAEEGTQKVRVWHDTAVITETLWVKGAVEGKPVDQKMSVTATYVRTPNGWRRVSAQASAPVK